jgi:hypothetical protein
LREWKQWQCCGGTRELRICVVEGKHFFNLVYLEKTMREQKCRLALESSSHRSRRRWALTATASLLAVATSSWAVSENEPTRAPRAMALNAAERAELIDAAVSASAPREASATERQLLNLSREESRAMMSKQRVEAKSLGAQQPVRVIKNANSGVAVLGTALMSKQSVVITKDGKHLHTCGSDVHAHKPAVQQKIEAAARVMAALKGGVRE